MKLLYWLGRDILGPEDFQSAAHELLDMGPQSSPDQRRPSRCYAYPNYRLLDVAFC